MRILHIPDPSAPTAPSVPAPDLGRVEALERIAKSMLQRIQDIEERVKALEQPQPMTEPSPVSIPAPVPAAIPSEPVTPLPLAKISMDTVTLKKDLFSKMWKHLNDKAAA